MVEVRELKLSDSQLIYEWRNSEPIKVLSSSQKTITFEEHQEWIKNALKKISNLVLIIENESVPIGQIRFDLDSYRTENAFVSIYIVGNLKRTGIGSEALQKAMFYFKNKFSQIKTITALVREENQPSQLFFIKNKFVPSAEKLKENHETYFKKI